MEQTNTKQECIYRYDITGKLVGIQEVSGWSIEEVKRLVLAIQKRGDGSWASTKKLSGQGEVGEQNEANEAD